MKCPACSGSLNEKKVSDLTVDVCEGGCGGVGFDWLELKKVDEPHEHLGESLLDVKRSSAVRVDHEQRRNCPRCDTQVLSRHFFSVKRQIEVDECPKCGGFWLDSGELAEIRPQYKSEEERKQAAKAVYDDLFDDELDRIRKESEEETEKVQRIARIFRFICPSYYIPGKQKWGAF
jgi:Zn-finger nucleic acid-binding protein